LSNLRFVKMKLKILKFILGPMEEATSVEFNARNFFDSSGTTCGQNKRLVDIVNLTMFQFD
jgi:hypothetical protein